VFNFTVTMVITKATHTLGHDKNSGSFLTPKSPHVIHTLEAGAP